jgi:hypothetical protein
VKCRAAPVVRRSYSWSIHSRLGLSDGVSGAPRHIVHRLRGVPHRLFRVYRSQLDLCLVDNLLGPTAEVKTGYQNGPSVK